MEEQIEIITLGNEKISVLVKEGKKHKKVKILHRETIPTCMLLQLHLQPVDKNISALQPGVFYKTKNFEWGWPYNTFYQKDEKIPLRKPLRNYRRNRKLQFNLDA